MLLVLFVCSRSPVSEGVFRVLCRAPTARDTVGLCSIGAWHVGEPPDQWVVAAVRARGCAIDDLRARALCPDDSQVFDWILVLDHEHLTYLRRVAPTLATARLRLFLELTHGAMDVPDPYYGDGDGFERMLDLIEPVCHAWRERLDAGTSSAQPSAR